MSYRLSVDVGGTFTDVVVFDDVAKTVHVTKTPSTPPDYSLGITTGIAKICKQIGIQNEDIAFFIHGTTVATNALLERKGAKTALITTEGFKDVIEIGLQRRPDLYNFWIQRPTPPIPRYLRFEIQERTQANGEISKEINLEAAMAVIAQLKIHEVESVAICFLNSYSNPYNEHQMKKLLQQELPDMHICTSADTLPEIREYERFCTTSVNAYLMPKVKDYINHLDMQRQEAGLRAEVHIMQSNGGIMGSYAAGERSVHTVFSGPAGGVLASIYMSQLLEEENIVTIDIGGTSSDLALIHKHHIAFTSAAELGGFPVRVPMVEMHTIGAGGGSIAWMDRGGGVRVGPQSAGSLPGPACYGIGDQPTVTDANLVLGYLNQDNFLGGEMYLDKQKSIQAIDRVIAQPMRIDPVAAASGILKLVNANMCGGISVVSTQKGYDLREFSLMAFGGGGSLHAAALAEELNMKRVIVPVAPGNFSAIGCQLAKVRYDYVRSIIRSVNEISPAEYNEVYQLMKEEALTDLAKEGFSTDQVLMESTSDMRYLGQSWELSVPVRHQVSASSELQASAEDFADIHRHTYGYKLRDQVVFVNLRLAAFGVVPALEFPRSAQHVDATPPEALKGSRELYFDNSFVKGKIYDRSLMPPGSKVSGPAMIEEYAASTPVPPGNEAEIDGYLNIVITRK